VVGAALLLGPVIFWPFTYDAVALPKAAVFSVLLFLALALLAASRDLADRASRVPLRVIGLPLAALLLITGLASALGPAPVKALVGDYQRYRGLLALLGYAALALFTPAIAARAAERRRLLLVIVGASLPVSLYAVSQHFGFDPLPWDLSAGREALQQRSFATLASPSFLGAYLALALPVGLALRPGASRAATALIAAAVGLGLPALLFTYSRGAWIGAVAGVAFVLAHARRGPRAGARPLALALGVSALLLGIGLGRGPSLLSRATSIADPRQGSAAVRVALWRSAGRMIRARPLLGWGPASFRTLLPAFAPGPLPEDQRSNLSSHSLPLDLGMESGLLGLAAFVWLVAAAWRAARRVPAEHELRPVASGALGGMVAFLVTHLFGFPMTSTEAPFWACLGLAAAAGQAGECAGARPWRARALILPAIIPAGLSVFVMSSIFVADGHLKSGLSARNDPARAARLLREATARPWVEFHAVRCAQSAEAMSPPHWAEAERSYRAALALDAYYGPNQANLARVYLNRGGTGALAAAREHARVAVAHDPYDADSRLLLGLAEERAGQRGEAEACYRRTLELRPDDAMAHNNLANLCDASGRAGEAERHYRQATTLDPNAAVYHYNLALFYLREGRRERAKEEARRAAALDPGTGAFRQLLLRLRGTGGR